MKKFNKECGEYVDHYTGRYDADHEPIYEKRWSDPGYAQLSKFLFNVQINTREFEFLFGGDWDSGRYHSYQSTSWAVADRILFYIDNEDRVEAFGRWQNWEVAERMATRVGMIDEDWLADQMTALESLSPTVYDREYGECDA